MTVNQSLASFFKDSRGYAAIVFGIMLLPLIGIAGGAVDFRNTGREQTAIRAAAEAAAVAAAKAQYGQSTSADIEMGGFGGGGGHGGGGHGGGICYGCEGGGEDDTTESLATLVPAIFNASYPNAEGKVQDLDVTYTTDDSDKTVTVNVTANAKTHLLQVIGYNTMPISVSARAAAVFSEKNVEVHFVFDMSPSMGTPDNGAPPPITAGGPSGTGCFFMCHDTGATIRAAGLTPKMDTIISELAKSGTGRDKGFVMKVGEAAETNPVPIQATFYGHYFDHHFHENAYFAGMSKDHAIPSLVDMLGINGYVLGMDGMNGGTDLRNSFKELHEYLTNGNPVDLNTTRRIIIIISDGMQARAKVPFDPGACTALKYDGDVYTVYIKNPASVYDNPNLSYIVPGGEDSGMQARDTWGIHDVMTTGGSSPYGYYSGFNNAETLMRNCAGKGEWAYKAETRVEIEGAFENMGTVMTAPTIRVLN